MVIANFVRKVVYNRFHLILSLLDYLFDLIAHSSAAFGLLAVIELLFVTVPQSRQILLHLFYARESFMPENIHNYFSEVDLSYISK